MQGKNTLFPMLTAIVNTLTSLKAIFRTLCLYCCYDCFERMQELLLRCTDDVVLVICTFSGYYGNPPLDQVICTLTLSSRLFLAQVTALICTDIQ